MSAWRRTSLQLLPEFRILIEASESPMELWIELRLRFDEAIAQTHSEQVRRFIQFAAWCVSDESGSLPNHMSTAAAVAFYEHLPQRREYWQYFPSWFSPGEFAKLLPIFSYHMGSDDIAELKRSYASAA